MLKVLIFCIKSSPASSSRFGWEEGLVPKVRSRFPGFHTSITLM